MSGSQSSTPGLGGDSWAGVCVHVTGYLLTATEPPEHFVYAANLLNKKKNQRISSILIFTFSFQVLLKPLMVN